MKNNLSNIKERVLLLSEKQEVSKQEFFKKIGITYGNFTGEKKKRPLNSDAIENILLNYPETNSDWLLTGRGEMLKSNELVQYKTLSKTNTAKEPVPYYDVDFIAGELETIDNQAIVPEYYMDIPEFSGCTAFRAYSDSMEKLIKSGSILFGSKIDNWTEHLEYGQIYGIISLDGRRYLKYIRKYKQDPQKYFTLKSENDAYDDFEMPKKDIRSIWLINGWLNRRT